MKAYLSLTLAFLILGLLAMFCTNGQWNKPPYDVHVVWTPLSCFLATLFGLSTALSVYVIHHD